jgi:hypothetical protein
MYPKINLNGKFKLNKQQNHVYVYLSLHKQETNNLKKKSDFF